MLKSVPYEFGLVVQPEFLHQIRPMRGNRSQTYIQFLCNLGIRQPLEGQLHDLVLTTCESL